MKKRNFIRYTLTKRAVIFWMLYSIITAVVATACFHANKPVLLYTVLGAWLFFAVVFFASQFLMWHDYKNHPHA